jgi:hypothetical protein
MKITLLFLTAISFLLNTGEALADLTLKEDSQKLSPYITSVKVCGHWEYKGKRGQYRIISGWIYGHSEIYVQWLADPDIDIPKDKKEKEDFKVMHTLSIPRFDDYESATDLTEPLCQETSAGLKVYFDADDGHTDQKTHVVIKLKNELGKFSLSETTRSN